jgi:hypothetical protein
MSEAAVMFPHLYSGRHISFLGRLEYGRDPTDSATVSDVAEKRGAWITVSQLEQLIREPYLRDRLPSDAAQALQYGLTDRADRERARVNETWQRGDPAFATTDVTTSLSDLVVFDNIFIDKFAAELYHVSPEKVVAAFGQLARMFCFVELPDEVYHAAIEVARRLVGSLPDFMQQNY